MRNTLQWLLVGILLAGVFIVGMMKPPHEIFQMLQATAKQLAQYSLLMHVVMLVAFACGLIFAKSRKHIFAAMMAVLAASATIVGMVNVILPNIVVFGLYLALILQAYLKGQLRWDLAKIGATDWLFGLAGMVMGFWYLHWVDSPLMLNALLYSPLGVLNCPTIVMISGLMILSSRRPAILEFTTGLVGVYFGFFGIMRLGAYVDVALVACGLYQLIRLGSVVWSKQPARQDYAVGSI